MSTATIHQEDDPSSFEEKVDDITMHIEGNQVLLNDLFNKHDIKLRKLQEEFSDIKLSFYTYLNNVINDCASNSNILSNILSELQIAEANGKFDLITLKEINENCERLLKRRDTEKCIYKDLSGEMLDYRYRVNIEKKFVRDILLQKACCRFLSYYAFRASDSIIRRTTLQYQDSTSYSILSNKSMVAVGAVSGLVMLGAICRLINYCNLRGFIQIISNLKQIESKISLVIMSANSLEFTASDYIKLQLKNYICSSEKNIKYHNETGERSKVQARKMIEETIRLKLGYSVLSSQANRIRLNFISI